MLPGDRAARVWHARILAAAEALTGQVAISVTCPSGTPYTLTIGVGQNFRSPRRRMRSSECYLDYDLYRDAACPQVWGASASSGVEGLGIGSALAHRVPA
ncbi:MAG: spore coat protein U domain-containing protein [candidate division NC10 bacterium]